MAGKRSKLKSQQGKAVGRAPTWLKTVQIAKPHRSKPVQGSFGAASSVTIIDPRTGLPRDPEGPV